MGVFPKSQTSDTRSLLLSPAEGLILVLNFCSEALSSRLFHLLVATMPQMCPPITTQSMQERPTDGSKEEQTLAAGLCLSEATVAPLQLFTTPDFCCAVALQSSCSLCTGGSDLLASPSATTDLSPHGLSAWLLVLSLLLSGSAASSWLRRAASSSSQKPASKRRERWQGKK